MPCRICILHPVLRLRILFSFVQPSSRLTFRLYAKRLLRPDKLIGTHEILMPVESQSDAPFVLKSSDELAGESVQPATLYLTITVTGNTTSRPILLTSATVTEVDASPMEHATLPTIADAQDIIEATPLVVATTSEHLSSPTDHVPIETSSLIPPVSDAQATMSPAGGALHVADKATEVISLASTWEGSVERIKWVMDTLNPYAQMACDLVLAIPKVHRFVLLSEGNADAVLIWSLDTPSAVSK
ncbi:hypothetical protein EI94DRAFT_1696801 [Lactarius quietus]|nr:hypothetical protein EI94DRAFT_1696801 [Lactarius quietus]